MAANATSDTLLHVSVLGELQVRVLSETVCVLLAGDTSTSSCGWHAVSDQGADGVWVDGQSTVRDTVRRSGDHAWEWRRVWRNVGEVADVLPKDLLLRTAYRPRNTIIPAVSYRGNAKGTGGEPKATDLGSAPWQFASNRTALPGGSYSQGGRYAIFTFIAGDTPAPAVSLIPRGDRLEHRLSWPDTDAPWRYVAKDEYAPPVAAALTLAPQAEFAVAMCLVVSDCTLGRSMAGWGAGVDEAWRRLRRPATKRFAPDELWKLGIAFAGNCLWHEDDDFSGFSSGLLHRNGAWTQREAGRFELGWAGQNAALSVASLHDYLRTGAPDSLRRGKNALDDWATRGLLPNGLPMVRMDAAHTPSRNHLLDDYYKTLAGGEPVLDATNLAQGAEQYLRAAQLAPRLGINPALWLGFALRICEVLIEGVRPDGTLTAVWNADGHPVASIGTAGAAAIPAFTCAFRATRDARYIQAAAAAIEAYGRRDLLTATCSGGALDTNCVDKESAYPLLAGALDLWDVTRDDRWLRWAELAAHYLATWLWLHTIHPSSDSELNMLRYDTFAGTGVSVQHHHQDPWGALIALGWIRLGRANADSTWIDRAVATWHQASSTVSDGRHMPSRITRPAGAQDEAAFCSDWSSRWPKREDGAQPKPGELSEWLVAWPTAFRLTTLSHLDDWAILS